MLSIFLYFSPYLYVELRSTLKKSYCFGWSPNWIIFLGTNFKIFIILSQNPRNHCSRTGLHTYRFLILVVCLFWFLVFSLLSGNTRSDNMHCPEFIFSSPPYFSSQRNPVTILSEQGVTLFLFLLTFALHLPSDFFFLGFSDKT